MYWFPKCEYCRESALKNALGADSQKACGDGGGMNDVENNMFGFQWDADSIIDEGLNCMVTMLGFPMLGGPSLLQHHHRKALPWLCRTLVLQQEVAVLEKRKSFGAQLCQWLKFWECFVLFPVVFLTLVWVI